MNKTPDFQKQAVNHINRIVEFFRTAVTIIRTQKTLIWEIQGNLPRGLRLDQLEVPYASKRLQIPERSTYVEFMDILCQSLGTEKAAYLLKQITPFSLKGLPVFLHPDGKCLLVMPDGGMVAFAPSFRAKISYCRNGEWRSFMNRQLYSRFNVVIGTGKPDNVGYPDLPNEFRGYWGVLSNSATNRPQSKPMARLPMTMAGSKSNKAARYANV